MPKQSRSKRLSDHRYRLRQLSQSKAKNRDAWTPFDDLALRSKLGYEALSIMMDVTQQTIWNWRKGKCNPSLANVMMLEDYVNRRESRIK